MKGRIYMNVNDLDRLQVIEQVCKKKMKTKKAAKILGISVRQVKRLKKRFNKDGAKGLISQKVGTPSNNKISSEKRLLVLNFLNYEDHRDFSPVLVHEYISKEHPSFISITSVRQIMIQNGLWSSRKTKSKKVYRLRQRRPQEGELVQLDGSEHDWFEGRGSRCTLLVYVDDATSGTLFLKFVRSENTMDYMEATKEYIEIHGRPRTLYPDKHSVFKINHKGALSGDGRTQFARAMEELGIGIICANSPQAKGRVERKNRDFQNRLVKAMRLAKICTIEAANAFIPPFLEEFNRKFAKVPFNPINAHRPLLDTHNLDRIFCLKYTRCISKNLTLSYKNTLYQIYADRLEYTLRNTQAEVFETKDGKISFERNGKVLKAIPYREMEADIEEVSGKELLAALASIKPEKKKRYIPGRNHPWKRGARLSKNRF